MKKDVSRVQDPGASKRAVVDSGVSTRIEWPERQEYQKSIVIWKPREGWWEAQDLGLSWALP